MFEDTIIEAVDRVIVDMGFGGALVMRARVTSTIRACFRPAEGELLESVVPTKELRQVLVSARITTDNDVDLLIAMACTVARLNFQASAVGPVEGPITEQR